METKFEKLSLFFDRVKNLNFWQRIFGWRQIQSLSYDAHEEFKTLLDSIGLLSKDNEFINVLKNDKEHLDKKVNEQENEIAVLKSKVDEFIKQMSDLGRENTVFKESENNHREEYQKTMRLLTGEIERIRSERNSEKEQDKENEIQRIEGMRQTWAKHQENVKNAVKMICQRHTIEFVDKVPFRGDPDNTLKINNEFVIFDAKSPASDDLQNFPIYIRSQAESVKKYIKEEGVRKDIFLVIPSNTVEIIRQFTYNMGGYTVYVVTLDVLEPLMLSLKKIEDYEFANELSPEDRDNICRVIGKFAHMAKRRIQIDHFFAWEFLEALTKCKSLPTDILKNVIEFERSEKLNPPQERRGKQILTQELQSDAEKIQKEAEAKAIVFPPSLQKELRELPLYEGDESDTTEKS